MWKQHFNHRHLQENVGFNEYAETMRPPMEGEEEKEFELPEEKQQRNGVAFFLPLLVQKKL